MRALLLVVAMSCGGPAPKSQPVPAPDQPAPTVPAPNHPAPHPRTIALDMIVRDWAVAALSGDWSTARHLSISHAQLTAISTKQVSKEELDDEVKSFLDGLAREGKENPDAKVVGSRVIDSKTLPAGEKLKRPLEIARVRIVLEVKGERAEAGPPLLFLLTDDGWRFSPKN